MKKVGYLLLSIFLLGGCGVNNFSLEDTSLDTREEDLVENEVLDLMSKMTIEEKIGQMLVIKYSAKTVSDDLKNVMHEIKPGGFILFGGNISTFENTKNFIKDLKQESEIPLIVSIDEEGGRVQKLELISDKEVLPVPSMKMVGDKNDEKLAYDVGVVLSKQLMTLGINVTFAPVLDIVVNEENTTIGDRSFSNDPLVVEKMAKSVAKGIESMGIIATYKHFPGHGPTAVNSHNALPIIDKNYNELLNFDLKPYVGVINDGAKMIMVGHLAFPNITGDNTPASLSKKIVTDILINELNYKGLIITDALDMGALINNYSEEEITLMAINAGVDMLLMPRNLDKTIEYIKNNISEERINKSVYKILMFKYQYLKDYELLDESYLNNDEQRKVIQNFQK